jgi:hypothetical protein
MRTVDNLLVPASHVVALLRVSKKADAPAMLRRRFKIEPASITPRGAFYAPEALQAALAIRQAELDREEFRRRRAADRAAELDLARARTAQAAPEPAQADLPLTDPQPPLLQLLARLDHLDRKMDQLLAYWK